MIPSGGEYQIETNPSAGSQSLAPTPASSALALAPQPPLPPPHTSVADEKSARLEKFTLDERADREARQATAMKETAEADQRTNKKQPIKYQDALGRKFILPYPLCKTWAVSSPICHSPL